MQKMLFLILLVGFGIVLLGGAHQGLRMLAQSGGSFSDRAAATCGMCHGG
jgi:cytochrome c553